MSKKIISVALAVVMLISVFACSAFATSFPGTSQIGVRLVSDAYVGMPAGSTVTVKAYYVLPDDASSSYMQGLTNLGICFTDAFTYNYTGTAGSTGRTWGASYSTFFTTSAQVTVQASAYNNMKNRFNEADKARNWTNGIIVAQAYDITTGAASPSTGYKVDPYCELFTITFTTTRTLTADDTIGIPAGTIGSQTKFQYINNAKQVQYTVANVVTDEFVSSADYVSVNEAADLKIRNNASDTNKVDLGITGEFKNVSFPVEFGANGTTCTNLSKIGVEVRMNGVIRTADCDGDLNYIYPTADGYKFRAAVTGVDAAGLDSKVEVRVYMVTDNGTYYSNWMGCTARTAYTNAVAGGMSAIA